MGIGFLYWAVVLLRNKNVKAPMATFRYSIVYLGVLFLFLLADHYLITGSAAEPGAPLYLEMQPVQA